MTNRYMRATLPPLALVFATAITACAVDNDASDDAQAAGAAEVDAASEQRQAGVATALATGSDRLPPEELEARRMDMSWRQFVERDAAGGTASAQSDGTQQRDTAPGGQTPAADEPDGTSSNADETDPERWEDISPETVNEGPVRLPVGGDVEGPSVLRVQVLLDRALFSPGVIDGRWGRNTEKAVYWFQEREGLNASGEVDERTWERLQQLANSPRQLATEHRLTEDDVSGPFVDLPEDYYDRRDMECQCYESLAEKLAERFHATESLLAQLNPDVNLNGVSAGQTLWVPAVADRGAGAGGAGGAGAGGAGGAGAGGAGGAGAGGAGTAGADVARLVISDGGGYLHALDADGRIVYHFPATLGADYSPSPTGEFRVTSIAPDPTWHYQPAILEGVDDDLPDAVLPPGPNNAVGTVWMELSKPSYGIHGTSAPETIGYATSNGCIRLTNWDAEFLSSRIEEGIPVEFRDVTR